MPDPKRQEAPTTLADRFERFVLRTRTDSLSLSIPGFFGPMLVYGMEMLLGGDRLTRHVQRYFAAQGRPKLHLEDPAAASRLYLEALQVDLRVWYGSVANIPENGPLVVVGNHPHGFLEVMAACAKVLEIRSDLKVLVNLSIADNPLYRHFAVPVDLRGTRRAAAMNLRSTAAFRAHLKSGGVVLLAPSGAISDRPSLDEEATDWEWRPTAAKWARQTGATVLPLYCDSENDFMFHLASKIWMPLRLGLVAFQNWRLRGKTLNVAIGDPVSPETMAAFPTALEATEYLREKTYALQAHTRRKSAKEE